MKGIREAAMSKEEQLIPRYPSRQTSLYDYGEYNPTLAEIRRDEAEYENYDFNDGPINKDQIIISLIIENEALGNIENDFTNDGYDWEAVEMKAKEIAYDRIKELLNKDFESKYEASYQIEQGLEIEATVTLTPITK